MFCEDLPPYVYQFKVSLCYVEPPFWRRVQVPEDLDFYALRLFIEQAMGWSGTTEHFFEMADPVSCERVKIGRGSGTVVGEHGCRFSKYFEYENQEAIFGCSAESDGHVWLHRVVLEQVLVAVSGIGYPRCVGGERVGPGTHPEVNKRYVILVDLEFDPRENKVKNLKDVAQAEPEPRFDPNSVNFEWTTVYTHCY